uniref:Kelch domain containing 7A n=1 Tax=Anas platyrhynchos TaxID=8839 RepID=A0A8B9ZJS2_ANAPL
MSQRVTVPWQSDMQLAGKLVLSAAALLLLTLAYRFYKSRSAPSSPGGSTLAADACGETERRENTAQDGEVVASLRRRQVFGGGAWQGGGNARVSALEPRQVLARRDRCLPVGKEEERGEPGGSGDLAEMLSGEEGSGHGHGIAENPQLQLPMEGFGAPLPANTPPASPRLELVAGANFFQMSPPAPDTLLDLGNCYEVLCMAKAEKLSHLQEAAYKVMSDNYLQVLRTPSIYGRLNARERELILQRRMKGKMCVTVADISTQDPDLHASRLCYYDDGGDRWYHLCHMPPEAVSQGCAMCSMFNYLFVVAGCEGSGRAQRPSKRVFCYDPLTNIWREICSLNQARPHCKLVALDGCLYAIGGECLYTVERYDPRQDRWTFTAPLPHDTFAVAHTATVCDGEIYVTGGTLRYVLLRYAARRDSWIVSPAGGSKDRTAEMVSTKGFIYRFDLNRSMGIGVYRCGAKAKLWYECATYPMPYPSCFQCAVVGGLVHCIGRRFHLRFLADHISPRFGTKELQPFPSPRGSLLPAVLVLPQGGMEQVQV